MAMDDGGRSEYLVKRKLDLRYALLISLKILSALLPREPSSVKLLLDFGSLKSSFLFTKYSLWIK